MRFSLDPYAARGEHLFVMGAQKPVEYAAARRLRREDGMPLKRIATRLGISVASAHLWTKDIPLTAEQQERNRSGPTGPQNPAVVARRTESIRRASRARRASAQQEGRERARSDDALHQAGCMLYWAEGSKNRNSVRFCNSDLHMVAFFKRFLMECFGVEAERFRLSLHVYLGNGLSIGQVERYWLDRLDLPPDCVRKHYVNPRPTSSSGRKTNKLPYGVCTLAVHDTRIAQHIYGAIQEYADFDEPRWLDGAVRRSTSTIRGPAARAEPSTEEIA